MKISISSEYHKKTTTVIARPHHVAGMLPHFPLRFNREKLRAICQTPITLLDRDEPYYALASDHLGFCPCEQKFLAAGFEFAENGTDGYVYARTVA